MDYNREPQTRVRGQNSVRGQFTWRVSVHLWFREQFSTTKFACIYLSVYFVLLYCVFFVTLYIALVVFLLGRFHLSSTVNKSSLFT